MYHFLIFMYIYFFFLLEKPRYVELDASISDGGWWAGQ